jgi:hypothetical protein
MQSIIYKEKRRAGCSAAGGAADGASEGEHEIFLKKFLAGKITSPLPP